MYTCNNNSMYVSGPVPDRRKERQLGSAMAPYTGSNTARSGGELSRMFGITDASQSQAPLPASSRRNSGPLPPRPSPVSGLLSQSQLWHLRLIVGPSPLLPAHGSSSSRVGGGGSSSSRRGSDAGKEVVRRAVRLGVPLAWYVVVAVVTVAALGAGVYCLVSWRRWEVLTGAGAVVTAVASLFAWNVCRKAAEAERFLRWFPDTFFDQEDMPVGEQVKITGQVTCAWQPLAARFHDAARCVFTSYQLFEHRGWASCCNRWQLRHSEERVTDFYISDSSSGKVFFVRAGEGAKITPMIKRKTISLDEGNSRIKEGFIREGEIASVIGVLKQQHVVEAHTSLASTGCLPTRFMFPVHVEQLILIGSEDPGEVVYVV